MTNNWTDIGNSSLVVVMGANPSENHPACMAHINAARAKGGKLVVLDPRKTRTAAQADRYIRFRPGTDIPLINGVVRGVIEEMERRLNGIVGIDVSQAQKDSATKFYEFLNQTASGSFYTDGDGASQSLLKAVAGNAQYTDARFLVETNGSDYQRGTFVQTTGLEWDGVTPTPADGLISNFPKKAANVFADANTVYNRLKAHVAPYTSSLVANICGCTEDDIAYVIDAYIDNGRCSSVGVVTGAGSQDPRVAGYKATTMLYAMGLTQHTCGGQNVKSFAVLQCLMGNAGRAGGGINALRGIHNVQGSTDMGNLYHLIPFYSGNPTLMTSADANAFGKYMNNLWGLPVQGTGGRTTMNGSYDDAYNDGNCADAANQSNALFQRVLGLQQRGFLNMTYNFFGEASWIPGTTGSTTDPRVAPRALTNALYDLWPKTNGDDHITMFRKMGLPEADSTRIKAAVVWGQNPAVTEPNQSAIRDGLFNLDTLVCVDMFANETAQASRKPTGVTYLLPACSHVEEAGSVANSGRVLQWRERAILPRGNSKADLELIFRLAKALDDASAFTHITATWTAQGQTAATAYDRLYASRYGWTPTVGVDDFETAVSGTAEIWRGADDDPSSGTVFGSEWVAELMYRELCTANTGASWLYVAGYSTNLTTNVHTGQSNWRVANRSKSRETYDPNTTLAYPGWGYAWLVNRRVLYNNGDIPGDVADFYMGPDSVGRLYVTTATRAGVDLNYSRWYRFYHRLSDKPDIGASAGKHVLAGRFPGHTEPYETPRTDLLADFGRNTRGGAAWELVPSDTPVVGMNKKAVSGAPAPLVLTTIRCVEHFQGGPITRNNPWNHEAEPEPWVEINSVDAAKYGVKDGQWVNVVTARSNSNGQQEGRSTATTGWAKGFKARVGAGTLSNQRVAPGVVAIPWHWGERGLSTGSRANDLCIDAGDANTTIPEYKACLCWITTDMTKTPADFVENL